MKGNRGVQFNDRQLAGQVRSLALEHLKKILDKNYKDKDYQKQMLLKLSSSLLPRLNEVSGADGEPLIIQFSNAFNPTPKTEGDNRK